MDKASTDAVHQNTNSASSTLTHSHYHIPPEKQHPDPILSRLRLNDQFGKPITNPKVFFRDCKVVAFFFSTIWKYHPDSFQNKVIDLCHRNPHRLKCIYVSVDSSKEEFDAATRDKPWINMIWEDGSNVDEQGNSNELQNIKFITPEEQKLIEKIIHGELVDIQKESRPISRVGLCSGLNTMFAPSLAIYHLEKKIWLEKNVSIKSLVSKEKRELALETWEKGERLSLTWTGLKWAILISIVGILYKLLIRSDDSYNIVHLVEKVISPKDPTTSQQRTPSPLIHDQPHIAHYNEF